MSGLRDKVAVAVGRSYHVEGCSRINNPRAWRAMTAWRYLRLDPELTCSFCRRRLRRWTCASSFRP